MKNTVYTYNRQITKNFDITDFSQVYYKELNDIFNQYPQYFDFVEVETNQKLELLAYKLYGNENYSDIILACNQENYLWSVPYENDIVIEQGDIAEKILRMELNYVGNNPDNQDLLDKIIQFRDYSDFSNSRRKRFRVPKVGDISSVISLIANYRNSNNSDAWNIEDIV